MHGCPRQGCKATNHTVTLRNLPNPASATYTSGHRNSPEPSSTFRNFPSGTRLWNLHQHTPLARTRTQHTEPPTLVRADTLQNPAPPYTTFRNPPPHRNSPEPSNLPPEPTNTSTHTGTVRNLPEPTPTHNGTLWNLPEPRPAHSGTFGNLPESASGTYTSVCGDPPEPSALRTFRNLPPEPTPAHTLRKRPHHHTQLSGTCLPNRPPEPNSPEPSRTCLRNLHRNSHQHTPDLSGTCLRNLDQHAPQLLEPSGICPRNLPPQPAPATRTGIHQNLSGLKTPLAYAVGERSNGCKLPWAMRG